MPNARGNSRPSRSNSNNRRRNGGSKKKSLTPFIIIGCVAVLALLGFAIYKMIGDGHTELDVNKLDKYVAESNTLPAQLKDGEAVYLDFSNGMNAAFASNEAKEVLRALVDKLNGKSSAATFYSLANNKITELETNSDTQLYNLIMNPGSYDNQSAPIQAALEKIVDDDVPALLITDYEEYNNGAIQQAAYAKESFINWLASGYTIFFYEWDYTEGAKAKKLFVTVFDDSYHRLVSKVDDAMSQVSNGFVNQYVLGGRDFAFPESMPQDGANYRNAKGKDVVTCVTHFVNYNKPQANAQGDPEAFAPLNSLYGPMAQYYEFGTDWEGITMNAEGRADFHLLSKLYVNFDAQSGFDIKQVEARAFNMTETIDSVGTQAKIVAPEVLKFVKSSMVKASDPKGYQEIIVDLDDAFTSKKLPAGMTDSDLIRINLQISEAAPRIEEARQFFSWEGNNSLASSVINTLQSEDVTPVGRVIFSYYIKAK